MHCRFAITLGFPNQDAPQFAATLGTSDPIAQIDYAAGLGFAGVDDPFLMLRPEAVQTQIGKALQRHGMAFGNLVLEPSDARAPLWGRSDADARDEMSRRLEAAIAACARVGGHNVTLITGCDAARKRTDQISSLIDNLRRATSLLEQSGAMLCLEPTSDQRVPNLLLNSLHDARLVARAVDHPHVKLLFDVLHIQQAHGDLIENLKSAWDVVGAVQIADNPGRLEPGAGEINFVNFLKALLGLGHSGLICLEHINSAPGAAGERLALQRLREIDHALAA